MIHFDESARYAGAMKGLPPIQEMRPRERAVWLRETWDVEIQYSPAEECGYPMDILRGGRRIGEIVRSGNLVVLELPEVDELDRDKACGPDALEVWDFRHPQDGLAGDDAAARINVLIYCLVGTWAGREGAGRTQPRKGVA